MRWISALTRTIAVTTDASRAVSAGLVGPGCAGQITLHDLSIVQVDSGEHFAGRKEDRELVGIPGEGIPNASGS
jgi:hypothetical protein